jgi:hypothetical protein
MHRPLARLPPNPIELSCGVRAGCRVVAKLGAVVHGASIQRGVDQRPHPADGPLLALVRRWQRVRISRIALRCALHRFARDWTDVLYQRGCGCVLHAVIHAFEVHAFANLIDSGSQRSTLFMCTQEHCLLDTRVDKAWHLLWDEAAHILRDGTPPPITTRLEHLE